MDMALIRQLNCVNCGRHFAEGEALTCPDCGIDKGLLDVEFDLARAAGSMTRGKLAERALTHWRYHEVLPIDPDEVPYPENIGCTPLIEAPRLAYELGIHRLRLKDDSRSASGSYKDRASSIGVTRAIQEGASQIACASTDNAASSLAHCAAVAGLQANIFVSERIPRQASAHSCWPMVRVFSRYRGVARMPGNYACRPVKSSAGITVMPR
jgi:threonine synthase